ncbi:hypothetical protein AGOR_G00172790 [Albula goreensis]|uniref:Uncharacterized protein n=1 Tax=Albula goreensis TaxID=1534307 RepID=A0A8T3CU12_9TELE|nr:hypothetical protein AGOR_G00172790 [Albula goreensis]
MCSHSFCRACLKQCWDSKTSRECPVCRIEATGAEPPSNLVLKNLCEAFSQETSQRVSASSDSLCSLHGEKLKLFCLDDEEPICIICQTSEKHENHKLRPVQEAALKYKDDLGKALKPLKAKLEEMQKAKQTCDQRAKRITSQSEQGERQMREEFEKLHKFLRDEENSGIASMKEEEKKKGELVKRKTEALTKDMEALSCSIRSIEQEMRREDITFLQNYKDTKKRAQVTVQVPEEAPSEDMDVSKHLDKRKDRVMEKMLQVFQYLGEPSHWKTTMNSPDNKNMYFIVESSEYTRDHNVGRICCIEESQVCLKN